MDIVMVGLNGMILFMWDWKGGRGRGVVVDSCTKERV